MNFPVSIFASNKQKLILPNGFPFPTLDKNINSIADSQGGVPTIIFPSPDPFQDGKRYEKSYVDE